MTQQIRRMELIRQVALRADLFYASAEELGAKAAAALTDQKRAQISGLQAMANSALKVTDVLDFVKIRTARHKEWQEGGWGPALLEFLNHPLRDHRDAICERLGIDEQSPERVEAYLLLVREFVRQLAAHYEYACRFPQGG